eukprot:6209873-Pleurochrysis_carterae.AAC.1
MACLEYTNSGLVAIYAALLCVHSGVSPWRQRAVAAPAPPPPRRQRRRNAAAPSELRIHLD